MLCQSRKIDREYIYIYIISGNVNDRRGRQAGRTVGVEISAVVVVASDPLEKQRENDYVSALSFFSLFFSLSYPLSFSTRIARNSIL